MYSIVELTQKICIPLFISVYHVMTLCPLPQDVLTDVSVTMVKVKIPGLESEDLYMHNVRPQNTTHTFSYT